jgi:hypothetical protein
MHDGVPEVEIFLEADLLRINDVGAFTPFELWKIITRIDPTTRLLDPRLVLHPAVVSDLADACLQGMEIDLGEDFVEDALRAMSPEDVQGAIADIERAMLELTTSNATLEDKRIFYRAKLRRYHPMESRTVTTLDVVHHLLRREDAFLRAEEEFESTWDVRTRRPVPGVRPGDLPTLPPPKVAGGAGRVGVLSTPSQGAAPVPAAIKTPPPGTGKPPHRDPESSSLVPLKAAPIGWHDSPAVATRRGDAVVGPPLASLPPADPRAHVRAASAAAASGAGSRSETQVLARAPPPPPKPPPGGPPAIAAPERRVHPKDESGTPYTYEGFLEYRAGGVEGANKMWNQSAPTTVQVADTPIQTAVRRVVAVLPQCPPPTAARTASAPDDFAPMIETAPKVEIPASDSPAPMIETTHKIETPEIEAHATCATHGCKRCPWNDVAGQHCCQSCYNQSESDNKKNKHGPVCDSRHQGTAGSASSGPAPKPKLKQAQRGAQRIEFGVRETESDRRVGFGGKDGRRLTSRYHRRHLR